MSRFREGEEKHATATQVAIKKVGRPYDNCGQNSYPYDGTSQQDCRIRCESEKIIQECGCHIPTFDLPVLSSSQLCISINATQCRSSSLPKALAKCRKKCSKIDCYEERFVLTSHTYYLPWNSDHINYVYLQQNDIMVYEHRPFYDVMAFICTYHMCIRTMAWDFFVRFPRIYRPNAQTNPGPSLIISPLQEPRVRLADILRPIHQRPTLPVANLPDFRRIFSV